MQKQVLVIFLLCPILLFAQTKWVCVDSLYQPLPNSVHVYYTNDIIDGKPNIAYYVTAELKDKTLNFTTQIGNGKRLTPTQYFTQEQKPLLVMNCTFFEFIHNSNLNVVIKDSKLLAYHLHNFAGKGKDTLTYNHPFGSALGISKSRKADIAWLYTDSSETRAYASQTVINALKDSIGNHTKKEMLQSGSFKKWRVETAVGGGPVLIQNGEIQISNNEEMKFAAKAINDKHPRTSMGYTADDKLIMMVIEGRFPGKAEGATLTQEAKLLKEIGCVEALNLDGGGSSCLLINGKPTITPSDKEGQRPVPAVWMVKLNNSKN